MIPEGALWPRLFYNFFFHLIATCVWQSALDLLCHLVSVLSFFILSFFSIPNNPYCLWHLNWFHYFWSPCHGLWTSRSLINIGSTINSCYKEPEKVPVTTSCSEHVSSGIRAVCSVLYQVWSWNPPRMRMTQPLQATCSSDFFLCPV